MAVGILVAVGSLAAMASAESIGVLTFRVESSERVCFFQEMSSAQSAINLEFEVIEGYNADIGFIITKPNGGKARNSLVSFEPRRGGHSGPLKVNIPDLDKGVHEICFDNAIASTGHKVITMQDETEWLAKQHEEEHGRDRAAHSSEIGDLTELAKRLNRELEHPMRLQEYIKKRMHRHLWS